MSKTLHSIFISTMVIIVCLVSMYLAYVGYSYYITPLEERFYHPQHDWFKPSGAYGHGLGIVGTFLILFGVTIYIAHKRYNVLGKFVRLKYLLEFHIFLCTLGPILVLFHTAFKFGGIVSIAFWSMVAVVLSGVIGRFIYIQIPRTIEGRALSLSEVQDMKTSLAAHLDEIITPDSEVAALIENVTQFDTDSVEKHSFLGKYLADKRAVSEIKNKLREYNLAPGRRREILKIIKNEIQLSNRIARLNTMKKLFKYWHVAHLPFALIMLIIVVIHVIVTLAFGYKWIF